MSIQEDNSKLNGLASEVGTRTNKRQKIDYTKYKRKGVYCRKILRQMLKKRIGSNKIRGVWHQLRAEGRI